MTATLYVHLLGQFRLIYGSLPLPGVNSARLQSLLAYLILHRDAPQPRQQIAFQLWPDSTEAQARTNLRNLLHQLRHVLPLLNQYLGAEGQSLHWQPDAPLYLDVAEFENALARGAPAEAVALYGGELLPNCYDEWALAERDRLQQLFGAALQQELAQLEAARDYPAAIAQAERLLRHDPLREETYRHLMRLHLQNGDRVAALRAYHACAATLQRELAVAPSPPTQALYERLVNTPTAGPAAASPPPAARVAAPAPGAALVGRQAEWRRLQAGWQAAAAGGPCLWLLTGEAGIGKTRLAEELLAWAERQGITTASARCYAGEASLAYGPALAWLRAQPLPALEPVWLSELARLLPELLGQPAGLAPPAPLREAWQPDRLLEALTRAVLGQRQPLLLVIEDLQWCDAPTLEWLPYLLRFDARARLVVVGTLRSEDRAARPALNDWLAGLQHDGQLNELELGPLSAAETAALAAQTTGRALEPALAAALYQETEGNPFFVVELAQAGLADLAAPPQAGPAGRPAPRLPRRVYAMIAARLAHLSPAAHDLAGLAAAIGRDFSFEVLRRADGGGEEALVRGLDELWQRRLIREHGSAAYDFTHAQLRAVAYAELSAARRRLLHRKIAEALAAGPAPDLDRVAGQIAAHYERAERPELAVQYYRRAAEAARRVCAHAIAQHLLERALALAGLLPPAAGADDAPPSPGSFLAPAEAIDLLLASGDTQLVLGQAAVAQTHLQRALDLASQASEAGRTVQALLQLSWVAAFWGDFATARAHLEQALPLARALLEPEGGPALLAQTLSALGNLGWRQGQFAPATAALEEALGLAQAQGDVTLQMRTLSRLGKIYASQRQYAVARAHHEAGSRLARQTHNAQQLAVFLACLGAIEIDEGCYREAEAHCQEALQVNAPVGSRHLDLILCLNLGWAALAQNLDQAAAEHFLAGLRQACEYGATPEALGALVGLAQLRAQAGDPGTALTWLTLALHHPAADTNVREAAAPALDRLRATLLPDLLAAGEQQGRALRLEEVAAALLAQDQL